MDGVCDVPLTEHLCIYFLLVLFFPSSINRTPLSNHTLTQAHTVWQAVLNPVCVFLLFPERRFNDYLVSCLYSDAAVLDQEIFNIQLCNEL